METNSFPFPPSVTATGSTPLPAGSSSAAKEFPPSSDLPPPGPAQEGTLELQLRQQYPAKTLEQKNQQAVHDIYTRMEWERFINPHVRLPAAERMSPNDPRNVQILENGELRKSTLLRGLENALNAPCQAWDKSRSKTALVAAKSRAKKQIEPILTQISEVMAKYKAGIAEESKKLEEANKRMQKGAALAQASNNRELFNRVVEENAESFRKIHQEKLKKIDDAGKQLIALSHDLPNFIDCTARTNYLNALADGFGC